MIEQWIPSRRDLVVQGIVLLGAAVWTGVWAYVAEQPVWVVTLAVLGAVVLALVSLMLVAIVRGPRRVDKQSDHELVQDTIDTWMKRLQFGRREITEPGYSETIIIEHGLPVNVVKIGKLAARATIHVWSTRVWEQGQYNLNAVQWSDLRFNILLELARFGIFSRAQDPPYTIVFWVDVPVAGITERAVANAVDLIRRADAYIILLWQRETNAVAISQLTQGTGASPELPGPV